MKNLLLAITAMAIIGAGLYYLSSPSFEEKARTAFREFKIKHNKSYGTKNELEYRFGVFKNAMKKIEEVNNNPTKRYTLGINQFADLTFEEFSNQYLNLKMEGNADILETREEVPKVKVGAVDWRETRGAVGAVKDQGPCGSCWAFSTVCSLEYHYFKTTGKVASFSEQELVDCAGSVYGNYGCNGGLMSNAFNYIIPSKIGREESYPYKATRGSCQVDYDRKDRYRVLGYSHLKGGDVSDLIEAIDKQVVSVAIEVKYEFQLYKSGVYHAEASCGNRKNHAVAAVGYNTEVNDSYFIVRNSWNVGWGEDGYIKMALGTGRGTCGIVNGWDVTPDL